MARLKLEQLNILIRYNANVIKLFSSVKDTASLICLLIHLGQYIIYTYNTLDNDWYCCGAGVVLGYSEYLSRIAKLRNALSHMKDVEDCLNTIDDILKDFNNISEDVEDEVIKYGLNLITKENLLELKEFINSFKSSL